MISERLKKEDYEWAIAYLLGKLVWLYNKLDPNNIERNWQNFEDEITIAIKKHHEK